MKFLCRENDRHHKWLINIAMIFKTKYDNKGFSDQYFLNPIQDGLFGGCLRMKEDQKNPNTHSPPT